MESTEQAANLRESNQKLNKIMDSENFSNPLIGNWNACQKHNPQGIREEAAFVKVPRKRFFHHISWS